MHKISLLIPVYNDESRILPFYQSLRSSMKEYSLNFECIFIDNGSRDDTTSILHKICENDFHFHYITLKQNISIVGCYYIGAQYTQGDTVITMDLDHPPYMIYEFYKVMKKENIPYVGGLLRVNSQSTKSKKQRFFKAFKQSSLQVFFDEEDFDGFLSFIKHNHSDMSWIPYTNLEKQQNSVLFRMIATLNFRFGLSIIYVFILSLLCSLGILPLLLILYFQLDPLYSLYTCTLVSMCIILLIKISHSRFCCIHIQKKIAHIKKSSFDGL